jgi:hypothetical protein
MGKQVAPGVANSGEQAVGSILVGSGNSGTSSSLTDEFAAG